MTSFSGLNHSINLTLACNASDPHHPPPSGATQVLFYAPRNLAACATCSSLKLAMKKYEWS